MPRPRAARLTVPISAGEPDQPGVRLRCYLDLRQPRDA
ncbi:DUF6207 family protein [Streptomyces sp. NPDC050534]